MEKLMATPREAIYTSISQSSLSPLAYFRPNSGVQDGSVPAYPQFGQCSCWEG